MKISGISIHGFRGFNETREISLHNRLTLVSAANSYGKTSISEALEWLIYGYTSKVDNADSKDEYKGSYRNVHLPVGENPHVIVTLSDSKGETGIEAHLIGDKIMRFVDGNEVAEWPFQEDLSRIPPPFLLQHSLKNLLLATPVDRFEQFARLLGFSELDRIYKDLVALCTKAPLPEPIQKLRLDVESLESRASARPKFVDVAKALRKGVAGLDEVSNLVEKKCRELVPKETAKSSVLAQLLGLREEAVGKIFSGKISLKTITLIEEEQDLKEEQTLSQSLSPSVVEHFEDLVKLKAVEQLRELAELHDLGMRIIERDPSVCPLCSRPLGEPLRDHISQKHRELAIRQEEFATLEGQRDAIWKTLQRLLETLDSHHKRLETRVSNLLSQEETLDKLQTILVPKHKVHYERLTQAIASLSEANVGLSQHYSDALAAIGQLKECIRTSEESAENIAKLKDSFAEYLVEAATFKHKLVEQVEPVSEAGRILEHELDVLAGTQDISVLIDLLERRDAIRKKKAIDQVLESLKDLKREVDAFVTKMMLAAISGEFGDEVMDWYARIRTSGDPDVHFSGFDMKRTAQGGRVQIKAHSYGKNLVSAVSSLSESKLNALGLCISIAINMKIPSSFQFLMIDDPIQSWDEEHEAKFIEVIKELVKQGKQVVLLSHNQKWMKQVRSACAEVNGIAYEITGYTKAGPLIKEIPWAEVKHRLNTIQGILANPSIDKIGLQQAEEEVRLVITQLASDLHFKVSGQRKAPHKLNAGETKKLLLACGVGQDLANKLASTFETVDEAHHASGNYSVHREKLRTYCGWLTALHEFVTKVPQSPGISGNA